MGSRKMNGSPGYEVKGRPLVPAGKAEMCLRWKTPTAGGGKTLVIVSGGNSERDSIIIWC